MCKNQPGNADFSECFSKKPGKWRCDPLFAEKKRFSCPFFAFFPVSRLKKRLVCAKLTSFSFMATSELCIVPG